MQYLNQSLIASGWLCILSFCCTANVSTNMGYEVPSEWFDSGFSVSSTEHFFVAHDAGPTEAGKLAHRLEEAFSQFQSFFEQSGFELQVPACRLNWISFTDPEHFVDYVRRAEKTDVSHLTGYYSARTNRVVIVKSPQPSVPADWRQPPDSDIAAIAGYHDPNQFVKVAHELAHQLAFNTGLQKRGVMYPLWVSEGLATQYETCLSYCFSTNIARSSRLKEMQQNRRLIPLENLITITRLPIEPGEAEDLYAQSWGFFNFLLSRHPDVLKTYLENLYQIKPGFRSETIIRQEFSHCFSSIDHLNNQWLDYIRTQ